MNGERLEAGRQELKNLYREVDSRVAVLSDEHGDRLKCRRGCSACCLDGLTVFEVEASHIREHCGPVLREHPHPKGACAFLDDRGACRIYSYRPYVCRTQGLPLRWIETSASAEAETIEYRDICHLNQAGPALENLRASQCWTIGDYEGRLAQLQADSGGALRRVYLRDLFSDPFTPESDPSQ